MSNIEATDKTNMVVVADEPPLTKSSDSDACIDEIECFPKQYDCRNNSTVSESYSKFEQDLIAIYMKDLQIKQLNADQHIKLVQQQTHMTQEQYDNKLAIAKLMIKQMNHHHHLQEQKYMLEIQTLRELFNLSEQQWNARMNAVDDQLRQQQSNHIQIITELKDEIKQYNVQNQIYATESQNSASNFDSARLELNGLIEANQTIVQTLESKIDKQSDDLFAFRADTTADKEEMELMVQSWMTQCEALQQQVQDLQADLTSTKGNVEEVSTMHDEIKVSIEKMGQTYENVLEHVMEQIQDQADLQKNNYIQIQETHKKLQQGMEEANTITSEKFIQIDNSATIHEERIGSLEERYEKVNGTVHDFSDKLHATDDQVTQLKEAANAQSAAQVTTQNDVTGLQSIVAKLADASNNRFVRMETSFETEIKSVKDIKEEMMAVSEASKERVKVVDNKIVIHSIQLGEMSKDIKDLNTSISLMKNDHQKAYLTAQMECKEISELIEVQNRNQSQVNDNVMKSIASLETSSKNVEFRTSTIEKCIDTMTVQMDQFQEDHTKTRGNFMEQHQNMETTVTEQLQNLMKKISDIQQTTQVDVRNVADTLDKQIKDHQDKLDENEAILNKLNAHTVSTMQKHDCSEANVALLQADVKEIKQNIQKMDHAQTLRLNEHVNFAKNKLQHIADVVVPDQQESNKLLRESIAEMERRMKEQQENANKEILDRFGNVHNTITTMNNTMDELSKVQDSSQADFGMMKECIEKIVADISAVNDAFTSEVARGSELQTKLLDVEAGVQTQSAKASEIESALESYVTDYREAQEQSKHELNHSLAQVLTLSQMKEAMMNQIADCLVRLTTLDTSKAEHSKKIEEITKNIADHDVKIKSMHEENNTKLFETENAFEIYRVALDALKHDVQKQREVQKGVNDFVSQTVATCTVSLSEVEKRTTSVNSQLDDIAKNLNNRINETDSEIVKIMSMLEQQIDKLKTAENKFNETENSMREYQTKVSKDIKKTYALANDLKSTIDRHSDRLKTAKDARIVIRNDLKSMVDSMNAQLEYVRNQMNESKENFSMYLESMILSREELFNGADGNETLSKIDFLAGRFKAMNENSKQVQEAVRTLQDEINQWKDTTDQEITSQISEMASKIDYLTGKFKAMNEKAKHTNESIVQIQDEIANYKNDDNEKTTGLIEEISTKIDYLAGKFKSLNDHVKSTNAAISSLQDQVSQVTDRQSKDQEQLQEKLKEHDEMLTSTIPSMISEAVTKSLEGDDSKDVHSKLYIEFNILKAAFEEMNAQRLIQDTTQDIPQKQQEVLASKIEDMLKEIERISQQIQTLESEQRTMKVAPTEVDMSLKPASHDAIVDQLKSDVDRLSCQIEQNVNEIEKAKLANEMLATEVHGIYDRQAKYKKAIMKQHGDLKEFVNITPNMKQFNPRVIVSPVQQNEAEDVYHEARDAEDITSYSAPIEHREPE